MVSLTTSVNRKVIKLGSKALAKREMFDDQTSNIVWWLNILMFTSPGQTVQTCFIKDRQTSERKELWATKLPRVPQQFQHDGICEPNMFDTPGQTNQTSPKKHENKRNVWCEILYNLPMK